MHKRGCAYSLILICPERGGCLVVVEVSKFFWKGVVLSR